MAYRTCLVIRIKRKISLHSLCRENFFQKLFGQFHKSSYLCTAVPVVPLPDIQVLVMNPGFFMPFRLLTAKVRNILHITSFWSEFLRTDTKRTPRQTANIKKWRNKEREAAANGCRHGFPHFYGNNDML